MRVKTNGHACCEDNLNEKKVLDDCNKSTKINFESMKESRLTLCPFHT